MMGTAPAVDLSGEAILREREPLARKTTFRVGGAARFYAEPATSEDLRALFQLARREGLQAVCLGRGSNILAAEGELPYLVFRLQHPNWRRIEQLDDERLRVGAGLRLQELCATAARLGLGGFEFLEGIPGTVGGALRMNAGAMGGTMFEVVESVSLLREDGEEGGIPREQLHYGYRYCAELRESFATGAVLRSTGRLDSGKIREIISNFREQRKAHQPRESSAGCVFRNPQGDSAGRLIDASGLKGLRVGEAEVSRVHGNFIVNNGKATCEEVIELIRCIHREVNQQQSISLEPEVQPLGFDWKEVL